MVGVVHAPGGGTRVPSDVEREQDIRVNTTPKINRAGAARRTLVAAAGLALALAGPLAASGTAFADQAPEESRSTTVTIADAGTENCLTALDEHAAVLPCDGEANQEWELAEVDGNAVTLEAVAFEGRCLASEDVWYVALQDCEGGASETWALYDHGKESVSGLAEVTGDVAFVSPTQFPLTNQFGLAMVGTGKPAKALWTVTEVEETEESEDTVQG
uniref:Uncharacterized protein n=1 Tax=Actinosynnema pretiosum subsp. pretiosum TaxID=103721 RepID=A0A1U9Y7Q0_9PSEU|nr:hypothetical protein [Actinosynnema pretiosum subsp. pretiosum]